MSRYELVIFDFDGTLADTAPVITESFSEAVQGTQAQRPPAAFQPVLGQPLEFVHDLLVESVPDYRQTREEFVARYRAKYREVADQKTQLFAGVRALLDEWASPLAIASSKPTHILQRQVNALDIDGHFSHVQGTDGFPYKPDPTILHRVWERVPAAPRGTVFVGDSVTDVMAGRAAGVVTIGVTYGAHARSDLVRAGAEFVVDDVGELRSLLI